MSSIKRKIYRNKPLDIKMSIKFKCPDCGIEKIIPREEFQKLTQETFEHNKMFYCVNCNIRMNPITIEVDY